MNLAFIGLGGNVGPTRRLFLQAIKQLRKHVDGLEISHFYKTSPVSPIPQDDFLNAACKFHTSLSVNALWDLLTQIERELGKVPKERNAPRPIDIDLLFFGNQRIRELGLEVPHPRWSERLFVLRPLADLTRLIEVEGESYDLAQMIANYGGDEVVKISSCGYTCPNGFEKK
jgi:2-amino-4-hydroxy-6-hydroxymethyldihydropteridine diphosphokinase